MAMFSMTSAWPLRSANAVKNLLSATANWAAIGFFLVQGTIAWPQTITMLFGAALGGYFGARMLSFVPAQTIRYFVVAMGVLMTLTYAWRYWL
jgi:uncharacterized protein